MNKEDGEGRLLVQQGFAGQKSKVTAIRRVGWGEVGGWSQMTSA